MLRLFSCCFFILYSICSTSAQIVTHVPFTGGVTSSTARVYLRTSQASVFEVLLSDDSLLFSNFSTINGSTQASDDSSGIANLSGLKDDKKYFYKIRMNGNIVSSMKSFKTFPKEDVSSHFKFLFGSCQEQMHAPFSEPIFTRMIVENPLFFLQCGDWGYPDTTDVLPINNHFFSEKMDNVKSSYRIKYNRPEMMSFLSQVPVDYCYDDHDYMNDNAAANFTPFYLTSKIKDIPNPVGARENSIRAYTRLFPAYQMVDTTQGIYHSFRCGNIEVFMCDDRASRSPELECLIPASFNTVAFQPTAAHSLLGKKQMDWLINGLKSSTAKWKFIMTGVAFNRAYAKVLKFALNPVLQNVSIPFTGFTGKALVVTLIDTWNGFPDDQNRLINACYDNGISNVIFLTSDSHTSAIDDGSNSGFPEIMAGNLEHSNSSIAKIMYTLGFNVWSEGGQGIGNNNTRNAYGSVEVFGDDSVQLCIRDLYGIKITSYTVHDGNLVTPVFEKDVSDLESKSSAFNFFPSIVKDEICFNILNEIKGSKKGTVCIMNALGQTIISEKIFFNTKSDCLIDVSYLKSGVYFFQFCTDEKNYHQKFIKY